MNGYVQEQIAEPGHVINMKDSVSTTAHALKQSIDLKGLKKMGFGQLKNTVKQQAALIEKLQQAGGKAIKSMEEVKIQLLFCFFFF